VWTQTFDDEFTGTALGPQWRNRPSVSQSRTCATVGDPRAERVAHGTLRLKVMLDPDRIGDVCHSPRGDFPYYLNGQVGTPGLWSQTRGTFAARIRFPRNRGQHGAFWLQPNQRQYLDGNPYDSGAEIDVVEFFGQDSRLGGLASTVYNYGVLDADGNPVRISGMAPKATDWWKRYHVFSVDWTEQRYTFRVDGHEIFRTTRGVSGVPEYMLLSMLSSDWELAQAKAAGVEPGGTMKVDWVSVWQ
jgi:beta-glucanase (GH16 family)